MSFIRAFAALRVRPDAAARVSAPPYDVVNTAEARAAAAGNPDSFFHVSRAEIDLPDGADPHGAAAYAKAADNFARLQRDGLLVRDAQPTYTLYRLTMDGRSQLGLVAEVACAAYRDGRVKRHEFTRPDKEDDRKRHIEAIASNSGPVFLVFRHRLELKQVLHRLADAAAPVVDFVAADGVRHEQWTIAAPGDVAAIDAAAGRVPALYIADGHHRCAAAARVSDTRAGRSGDRPDAPHHYFFAVMFPDDEVRILDYNRVVRDLGGLDDGSFVERVRGAFHVEAVTGAFTPARAGEFAMNLRGRWYRLTIDPARVPADPVASLDVSLLQEQLLGPILGITDPRRDHRIDFVGGIRGLKELERRVAQGEAVAFALHPTSLAQLLAVADAGQVMPPKSTWFEPKLRDGLVCQCLDGAT